nr:hypothetical protein [Tanacetum cinerariifolium]
MDTTIDQQVARDEALVPNAKRVRIRRSNFCLLSDIKSKESTLQLMYDVLRLTPFFKAFLVTADVPEIYMQEFWATATVHHHSIRFKMDNKKHIVNLESFREMLHIFPRLPHQSFFEPPFEEEILAFLLFLGHSAVIRKLTDVSINKLHRTWRSFAAIINKCLTGKSLGYDSLRLSQAQILYGLYHKRNVDFAYLMWEDFVYQVEHKDTKKSNEMYYPLFTKVIIHHFMSKDPSIPRRNKTHISQASGPGADEGNGSIPGVLDVPTDESEEEISWNSTGEKGDDDEGNGGNDDDDGDDGEKGDGVDDDEDDDGEEGNDNNDDQEIKRDDKTDDEEEGGDDEQESDEEEFIHPSLSTHAEEEPRDEESFDPISKTPEDTDDEGNGEENLGLNVSREEGHDEEEEEDELYKDVIINQGRGIKMTQEVEDSHVTLTLINPDGQQQSSSVSSQFTLTLVASLPMSAPTLTSSIIAIITTTQQAPLPPTTALSTLLQDLPNFGSLFGFDHRLNTLEENFFEFMQTNQFTGVVSTIPRIVQRYMDQRMNEVVKVAVQLQSDHLRDEAQADNDEFLKTIGENMQKIIKEQVKEQVKLKKILIEKMEGNKSIYRSNEQRNLYKALVEAYESDKITLDTYGDTVTLKRRHDDDANKDEEPSAGPD